MHDNGVDNDSVENEGAYMQPVKVYKTTTDIQVRSYFFEKMTDNND